MKIGIVFPGREIEPTADAVRAWGIVNAAGVDHITISDHVLGALPEAQEQGWDRDWPHRQEHRQRYDEKVRFHETFVTLGFFAALCSVELCTGVLVLPQRQTTLVAKQAAQVDILTGGRLRLGVGVGWNAAEFESMGSSFHDRGQRLPEQVELLRRLWTESVVTFEGKQHTVKAAGIAPLPVQRPIPIFFGGIGLEKGVDAASRLLVRLGRLADGWCPGSATYPDANMRDALALVHRTAAEHGRDPARIGLDARLFVARIGRDRLADHISGWRELGASHLTFDLTGLDLLDPRESAAAVREIVAEARRLAGP